MINYIFFKKSKKIKIEVNTLDNIIKELNIKKVKLIKIDVEGGEKEVLKGSLKTIRRDRSQIIFEAWDREHLQQCKSILRQFDYQFKKIGDADYLAY